ncbi:ankyrin repeat [Anaeramoeba flamelloides]|uniref:Ankyrin repeat n=1 Tax=Anaeramoeba flamelloides TaxID=1746091 RepID=A0ABQ8Y5H2_9EUKA|nr:ankyrin repeat [Anaeramoeba flamelloides]
MTDLLETIKNNDNETLSGMLADNQIDLNNENKTLPLHYAISEKSSLELITTLLEYGSDPNKLDSSGSTALHLATQWEDTIRILDLLVQYGGKRNVTTRYKETVLMKCLLNQRPIETISMLILQGYPISGKTIGNKNILHFYCKYSVPNPNLLKLFLKKDYATGVDDEGCHPVHYLCECQPTLDCLKLLLKYDLHFDCKNKRNLTPFALLLSANPIYELIELLVLEFGVNMMELIDNKTYLAYALERRLDRKIINLLIDWTPEITDSNKGPLYYAIRYYKNDLELIGRLIKEGAPVNHYQENQKPCILYLLENNASMDLIKLFITRDLNLNLTDKEGNTPLIWLLKNKPKSKLITDFMVPWLDINQKDSETNLFALQYCLENDFPQTFIEKVLRFNPNSGWDDQKNINSFFHYFIKNKELSIQWKLLSLGPNLDVNVFGEHLIFYFFKHDIDEGILKYVLTKVNIDQVDRNGDSLLMWMLKYKPKRENFINYLISLHQSNSTKDKNGDFPLLYLLKKKVEGKKNYISRILAAKYTPNMVDAYGQTVLQYVIRKRPKKIALIKTLLIKGENPNIANYEKRNTVYYTLYPKPTDDYKLFKLLTTSKYRLIEPMSSNGETPLNYLLKNDPKNFKILKILLEQLSYQTEYKVSQQLIKTAFQAKPYDLNLFQLSVIYGDNPKNFLDDQKNSCLHLAIKQNLGVKAIRRLFLFGFPLDQVNQAQETPFFSACKNKKTSFETFKLLIDKGSDINRVDDLNNTALHYLARFGGTYEKVHYLFSKSPMLKNKLNHKSETPLHTALLCNADPKFICRILGQEIDINTKEKNGNTPLHCALIGRCQKYIVQQILEYQADVTAKNKKNETPLQLACTIKAISPEIIDLLLLFRSDVNLKINYDTPLLLSIRNGCHPDVIDHLLAQELDLTIKDRFGKHPLYVACELNRNPLIIKSLLEVGSDPNLPISDGTTPLFAYCQSNVDKETFELVVKSSKINHLNNRKENCLHYAIRNNSNLEMINILVENGIDINQPDENGLTPLRNAFNSRRDEAILLKMLTLKVDTSTPDRKENLLHYECQTLARPNVIQALLHAGFKSESKNQYGKTPILLLAENNKPFDSILTLLDANSNPNSVSDNNEPLLITLVRLKYDSESIETLISYGANVNIAFENESIIFHLLKENTSKNKIREKQISDILALFMKNQLDIKVVNNQKQSPLYYEIQNLRRINIIQQLIEYGDNVNFLDKEKNNLLYYASSLQFNNQLELCQLLVDSGSLIRNKYNAKKNILFNALKNYCNLETFKFLLAQLEKENPNSVNTDQLANIEETLLIFELKNKCRLEFIKALLNNKADPSYYDQQKNNAFHIIINSSSQKREEVLQLLFMNKELKYKWNAFNSNNDTPLFMALANKRSESIIHALLENGSNVNQDNDQKQTPLTFSIVTRQALPVVRKLLEFGANVNYQDKDKNTPLHLVVIHSLSESYLELLVEQTSVNLELENKSSETPLQLSIGYKRYNSINTLINKGANINKQLTDKSYPIFYAIANYMSNKSMLDNLLSKNVDLTLKKDNLSPLIFCIMQNCQLEVIKKLVENGADVNENVKKKMPIIIYLIINSKRYDLILYLIQNGVKIGTKHKDNGYNLFTLAIEHNASELICRELIQRELDVTQKMKNGDTPLIRAYYKYSDDLITEILERGADPCVIFKNNSNTTLLIEACRSKKPKNYVQLIISKAKNNDQFSKFINHHDEEYTTALYWSVRNRDIEIPRLLLENGADPNFVNLKKFYKPNIYLCAYFKKLDFVKLFVEYNADVNPKLADNESTIGKLIREKAPHDVVEYLMSQPDIDLSKTNEKDTLVCAINDGYDTQLLQNLIKAGCPLGKNSGNYYTTPLHAALSRNLPQEFFNLLLNPDMIPNSKVTKGIDINEKNYQNLTVFDCACETASYKYKPAFLSFLLQMDANPDSKNPQTKNTPLLLLTKKPKTYKAIIINLINLGANINYDNDKSTPFLNICENDTPIDLFRLFLSKNIKVNKADFKGNTALHYLCLLGYDIEFFMDLLKVKGVKSSVKNTSGDTALHIACRSNLSLKIIKLLVKSGAKFTVPNKRNERPIDLTQNQDVLNYYSLL